VFVVGPARRAVVLHPLEGQIDLAEGDAGEIVGTALHDGVACHLGVEGRQLHRVRAVDDETQELKHQAILPQSRARAMSRRPPAMDPRNPDQSPNPFKMDDFCPAMSRFAYGGKQMAQYRRNCRAAAATFAGFLAAQVLSPFPHDVGVGTLTAGAVGLLVVFVVGIVVHELGHVLAIRLAGRQPTVVHLLGPSHRVLTFHFGTVPVRVGFKGGGRVEYPGDGLSVWQSALIAAAGPAAELVIAPLLLLLPVARWESDYFACCVAAWAIGNLIPAKTPSGRLSDGAVLLQVRARARAEPGIRDMLATPGWSSRPDAASRLIKGWVLDVPEAEQCLKQLPSDRATLLKVYAQDVPLPVSPATAYLKIVHALSWKVVAKPWRACGA
jgi:hypothetical protein